jgi:hypothetical protein
MRKQFDRDALLAALSKRFVAVELGIDPNNFAPTPDTAWISVAARSLRRLPAARPSGKTASTKQR